MEFRSYPNPLLGNPFNLPDGIQNATPYYWFMQKLTQFAMTSFFNIRAFNRHFEPAEGGVVLASNHQSFLDPPIVGMALKRPCNFMARSTLFKNPVFSKFISSVNAMPIKRGTADTAAMKESVRRLKNGRQIVIFPEGTRSKDGKIAKFLPGMALLSQRAATWTLPAVIDGAFDAWPRSQKIPSMKKVYVAYGEPIHRDEARKYKSAEFVKMLRERLIHMQCRLREHIGKQPYDYSDEFGDSIPGAPASDIAIS